MELKCFPAPELQACMYSHRTKINLDKCYMERDVKAEETKY